MSVRVDSSDSLMVINLSNKRVPELFTHLLLLLRALTSSFRSITVFTDEGERSGSMEQILKMKGTAITMDLD